MLPPNPNRLGIQISDAARVTRKQDIEFVALAQYDADEVVSKASESGILSTATFVKVISGSFQFASFQSGPACAIGCPVVGSNDVGIPACG